MSGRLKTVLLVDDERQLVRALARSVRALGHKVTTASDGARALELSRGRHFDLVVTDLRMPALDGASLIARLLEDGFAAPVIVMTGFATLEAAIDCLRKGAVDFLVKPFEVETFQASVTKALTKAAHAAAAIQELDWEALREEYDLTRRQLAMLQAFHETGDSNQVIASRLCLSVETVKSHLRAVFDKLGISNRAQLFRMLGARGGAPGPSGGVPGL